MIELFDSNGNQITEGSVVNIPSHFGTLVLERNSVLVLRCKDGAYDLDEMNIIRSQVQELFPNNKVLVMTDTIEPLVIHDKSYKRERPLAEKPYDEYYT